MAPQLSYFPEPDYAATMIDVQRDWHYQTYQRAIHKMLKMIEDGDTDNAISESYLVCILHRTR